MPASPERIEQEMKITRTPRDVGTTKTIQVTCYDNGQWQLDGTPMNDFANVVETVMLKLHAFHRKIKSLPPRTL